MTRMQLKTIGFCSKVNDLRLRKARTCTLMLFVLRLVMIITLDCTRLIQIQRTRRLQMQCFFIIDYLIAVLQSTFVFLLFEIRLNLSNILLNHYFEKHRNYQHKKLIRNSQRYNFVFMISGKLKKNLTQHGNQIPKISCSAVALVTNDTEIQFQIKTHT